MNNTIIHPHTRRRGRVARNRLRSAAPIVNPCPPGVQGGQYRPLSDSDCSAVVAAAMQLLSDLGMGEVPGRLADLLVAHGAARSGDRILLPEELVARSIQSAPNRFDLHGRDPSRTIEVGGDAVHFGTGGAAVQVLDIDTGAYRAATLRDLHDFTRLQDVLVNVSWFTRCCVATDMADPFDLDVNTVHALLNNTTKPVATSFSHADYVPPLLELLDIAAGGKGGFALRPFLAAHISPVISPLRFGEDAVDVTFACVAGNIPVSCITAAQSGATGPAPLANFLAQSLAETLASLVMVQAIKPGHPMIFSNWPFVIDLRTGAFSGGGGETAVLNAASAQLSNWLGLPSGVAASMTDAKLPDAQWGSEKGITALAAGLAGGNMIYESSGMSSALLGASFEGFVLDDEMISHIYRVLRGIEVNPDTLDFGTVRDAVLGDGHFLGAPDTMAAMERDYYYPALADRRSPAEWAESGAQDARSRARAKAKEILATHKPEYLGPKKNAEIRRSFRILA